MECSTKTRCSNPKISKMGDEFFCFNCFESFIKEKKKKKKKIINLKK